MSYRKSALALIVAFTVACGSPEPGPDDTPDDPEENPEDFPALDVSDACGGKCDDPNAVLNVSETRLLASLHMADFESIDGERESFALVGELLEPELPEEGEEPDTEEPPLPGHILALEISAVDGASDPDFSIGSELYFDGEQYVSDAIDSSALIPWQLLRVEVTGMHGDREIRQAFEFAPGFDVGDEVAIGDQADPFADALDVTLPVIYIDPSVETPDYERPSGVDGFNLGGTEFWQRWDGGHSPTFSYSAGTELGRKCMYASARRFEAIMREAPQGMLDLKENSNWGGSFFNWNDDYSDPSAHGRPRGAVLWAWRTHLIKWISQTGPDGSCFLPTLEQVERAARACQSTAERDDGAIEGCQAG